MTNSVWGLRLGDAEHQFLEQAAEGTDGILSKAGVARVLIRQAMNSGWTPLDTSATLGKPSEGSSAREQPSEGFTSKAVISTSSLNKKVSKCEKHIPATLEQHEDLILNFWKVKKGSRGDVAWNRLIGQLERFQDAYGSAVVHDQLELAINGKWAGIEVSRYESFLKPSQVKVSAKEQLTPDQIEAKKEAAHQARLKEWGLI